MQFLDEAKIFIKSGDGGNGCISFRRERNVPYGGPNGGNGGRGGSVTFIGVDNLNTLIDFRYQQHFKAGKGRHGEGSNCHGADGENITIYVPVGTVILDENKEHEIADITEAGQELTLVKGGNGGFGNTHFKSSVNRAPRRANPGLPGEEQWLWLRLKLLSDAGLVGLPNAGKSTFLAATTRATPKIADYPFTTLTPQLGVVYVDQREFVLADIPGLIEGAHEGLGLGDRFLGHVERCGVLLHLIDGTQDDVVESYRIIRHELESYDYELGEKTEIIALNKCDAMIEEDIHEKQQLLQQASGKKVYTISAAAQDGTEDMLRLLLKEIDISRGVAEPKEEWEETVE